MIRTILAAVLAVCLALPAFAQTAKKEILSKEAQYQELARNPDYWINSPLILEDMIIFFFRDKAGKVAVAGDFNEWKPSLVLEEKSTNFWQAVWTRRLRKGTYRYKLMVDDIWMSDPQNTNSVIDESGQTVSVFTIPADFIPDVTSPLWLSNDVYRFTYKSARARNVFLVADFNNWNPYNLQLSSAGGGEFALDLRLKPGLHVYSYVVDGEWKADPENLNQYSDEVGNIVSVVYVPDRRRRR